MNIWLAIVIMGVCTFLTRVAPILLMKEPIRNRFICSFLYYVPYVTLSLITVPAIVQATQEPLAGAAALVVGIAAAWFGLDLLPVSAICCATVLILEFLL